jgi:hypothetical protein
MSNVKEKKLKIFSYNNHFLDSMIETNLKIQTWQVRKAFNEYFISFYLESFEKKTQHKTK